MNDDDDSEILCPYCGQPNVLPMDAASTSQQFITDCEVCCRPFRVIVECEAGEIVSVDVQAE